MLIHVVVMVSVPLTVRIMVGNVFVNRTIWVTDVLFPWTKPIYVYYTIRRAYTEHATTARTPIRARAPVSPDMKENNALLKLMNATPIHVKTGLNASTISTAFTATVLLCPVNTAGNCAQNM